MLTLTNTTTARRSRNSAPNVTRLPDASSTGSSATASASGCPRSVSEPLGLRTRPAQPLTCRVTGAAIAEAGDRSGPPGAAGGAAKRAEVELRSEAGPHRRRRGHKGGEGLVFQEAEPRRAGVILRRRGYGGWGGATGGGVWVWPREWSVIMGGEAVLVPLLLPTKLPS